MGEKQPVQLHRSMNVKVRLGNTGGKETNMLGQLRDKMKGSKFRWINEQLYTQSGDKSLEMIKNDKELFDIYHEGFREQVPLISPRFHSIRFHVDSAPLVEFDFWEIELDEIFALAC